MRKFITPFCIIVLFAVSACGLTASEDKNYPKDRKDTRLEKHGKITGEGGLTILGGSKKSSNSGQTGIGVNKHLWYATLDTVSFMPLASADPFGGVVITDWYEVPETPGERFKLTVLILDNELRADAVKVSVFKQLLQGEGDQKTWRDSKVTSSLGREMEDKILLRARERRVGISE